MKAEPRICPVCGSTDLESVNGHYQIKHPWVYMREYGMTVFGYLEDRKARTVRRVHIRATQ